jgi:hypothetical protein
MAFRLEAPNRVTVCARSQNLTVLKNAQYSQGLGCDSSITEHRVLFVLAAKTHTLFAYW